MRPRSEHVDDRPNAGNDEIGRQRSSNILARKLTSTARPAYIGRWVIGSEGPMLQPRDREAILLGIEWNEPTGQGVRCANIERSSTGATKLRGHVKPGRGDQ